MIRSIFNARWWVFFLVPLGMLIATPMSARQIGSSSESKVESSAKLSVDKVAAGSTFKVAVILKIAEGWHINSHTPTYDYLIGTTLEPVQRQGVIVTDVRYPAGEKTKFAFEKDSLSVYQGNPTVFLTVMVSDKFPVGKDTLRARLEVQSCNNQVCLAPASIDVIIPVEIVGAGEKANNINDDLFSSYTSQGSTPPGGTSEIGELFKEKGSFVAFLAIFVIGLALNLTPCVYPMLSVTVSLFGGQTETSTVKVILKAGTLCAGYRYHVHGSRRECCFERDAVR